MGGKGGEGALNWVGQGRAGLDYQATVINIQCVALVKVSGAVVCLGHAQSRA